MAWMLEPAISMYLEGNGSFIDNGTASATAGNANTSSSSTGIGSRAAYAHRQQQQYGEGCVHVQQLALGFV
jgi:hypothetical protein